MKLIFKVLFIYLAIIGASTILIDQYPTEFGSINYWNKHGIFFLIFITLFPRLTLIFSSVTIGGFLWWLGLIFTPRLLVAFLATIAYWQTNPVLVAISWLMALGGESSEKAVFISRKPNFRFSRNINISNKNDRAENQKQDIEVEFERKS